MTTWIRQLENARKTVTSDNGKKKIFYEFRDNQIMVEEYDLGTRVLTKRAWKETNTLGSEGKWQVEIGEPTVSELDELNDIGIKEANTEPYIRTRMTKNIIEWRVKNMPYPLDTYSVVLDPVKRAIIVSTTNKKYYKEIPVLDLNRMELPMEENLLSFSHKLNTLIIEKPSIVETTAVGATAAAGKPEETDNWKVDHITPPPAGT